MLKKVLRNAPGVAPAEGWRRVEVTDRRTRSDWARVVRKLVDEDYPDKDRIVLVMTNASLIDCVNPTALIRSQRPGRASWLKMGV